MRTAYWTLTAALSIFLSSGFAQPRFAVSVNSGTHIGSTRIDKFAPLISAATWLRTGKSLQVSSEYQWYKSCDCFPDAPVGFAVGPFDGRNSTHRLAIGLHYALIKNTSSISLPGLYFAHHWSTRTYDISKIGTAVPDSGRLITDHPQRSVLFGSWTVLFGRGHFPFLFQARYGFSFDGLSSWSFIRPATFGQMVIGVRLKVF